MSSLLRFDVYVAPPTPLTGGPAAGMEWSPICSTLIQGARDAVLVDTPMTEAQATALADWIEQTAPGKRLTYLYITHGHGDHFFGAPVLQKRFPGLTLVATAGTIEHMKMHYSPALYDGLWSTNFPGQLAKEKPLPEPLPANGEFELEGHILRAVEVGHSDMADTTVLHVPDLKLVVAGDVVYGDCYQYFGETATTKLRNEWLAALKKVAELKPDFIVPGHKKIDQDIAAGQRLESTEKYILAIEEEVAKAKDADELMARLKERFPERIGEYILAGTCRALIPAQ